MRRLALITGAARGLGRAIAERLAQDGLEIVVADREFDLAQRTVRELCDVGATASALELDIGNEESVLAVYSQVEQRYGKLDVLVNNAAIQESQRAPVEQISIGTWERVMGVNVTGTLLMCRGSVPLLRNGTHSRIVNVSSRVARTRTSVHLGCYAASKAAVVGLSQVLASELGPDGITVNCVAPSTVRSAMTVAASMGQPNYFAHAAALTAVGRVGEPQDVADAVAYLCSSEADFVTGTVIDVTGGIFMP